MSCGNHHDVPCIEIRPLIVLFIDQEISDAHQLDIIEVHFGECPPCKDQMEQESQSLLLMRNLLSRCCNEPAPAALHERLIEQTQQLHQEMVMRTEITYSESTYTEITVDGQTQIEITSKIRREFPRE